MHAGAIPGQRSVPEPPLPVLGTELCMRGAGKGRGRSRGGGTAPQGDPPGRAGARGSFLGWQPLNKCLVLLICWWELSRALVADGFHAGG